MKRPRFHSWTSLTAGAAMTLAVLASAAPVRAQAPAAAALPSADFMRIMSLLTAFEQKAGRNASVLGQNNDIRRYASRVGDEQARSTQPLTQAAAAANIPVPSYDVLPPAQLAVLNTLNTVAPQDFDRMFMDLQVQTQQDALNMVQAYAQAGDNPGLKAAAAKVAPAFQQHVDQAKAAQRLAR